MFAVSLYREWKVNACRVLCDRYGGSLSVLRLPWERIVTAAVSDACLGTVLSTEGQPSNRHEEVYDAYK